MTVQELIDLLSAENPDAIVGTGYTHATGYVQEIWAIKHGHLTKDTDDVNPVVVLEQSDQSISAELWIR